MNWDFEAWWFALLTKRIHTENDLKNKTTQPKSIAGVRIQSTENWDFEDWAHTQ